MIQHFDTTIAERFGVNVAIIYYGLEGFKDSNLRAHVKHKETSRPGSVRIRLDDNRNWKFLSPCEVREAFMKMSSNGLIDIQHTSDENVILVFPVDHRELLRRQMKLYNEQQEKMQMALEEENSGNKW